jgi:hypothetical protein
MEKARKTFMEKHEKLKKSTENLKTLRNLGK